MGAATTSVRAEIGVPEGSPEIEAGGVRLAVSREGRGQPVVCLSAIGHGGGDFEAFAAAVKDRFEVIRIDWPGHGRSGADTKPASAARYAELLAIALDKLGVADPILIGNSIGGAAAIIHAGKQPVRALVACDTGGLVKVGFAARRFCGVLVGFFKAGVRRAWWYRPAFYLYYRFMVLPSPAAAPQRKRIIRAATDLAPLWRDAWESFRQKDADIRAVAQALDIPVWFAWAKRDRVIPFSLCKPCIETMKHASVTMFDAGHSAFLEQPEAFTREFLSFAAKLTAAGEVTPLATRRA